MHIPDLTYRTVPPRGGREGGRAGGAARDIIVHYRVMYICTDASMMGWLHGAGAYLQYRTTPHHTTITAI